MVGQVAQDVDNLIEKRDLLADEIHQLVKLDMPKVFGTTQQVTEFLKGSGCVLPSASASGAAAAPAASHAASAPATGSIASAGAVASGMAAANADASAAGAVVGMDANAITPAASASGVKLELCKTFRATVLQNATQVDQAFQDNLFSVMENEFKWNGQMWSPIGGWGPPSKIFDKGGANMVTDMHEVYCLLKLYALLRTRPSVTRLSLACAPCTLPALIENTLKKTLAAGEKVREGTINFTDFKKCVCSRYLQRLNALRKGTYQKGSAKEPKGVKWADLALDLHKVSPASNPTALPHPHHTAHTNTRQQPTYPPPQYAYQAPATPPLPLYRPPPIHHS